MFVAYFVEVDANPEEFKISIIDDFSYNYNDGYISLTEYKADGTGVSSFSGLINGEDYQISHDFKYTISGNEVTITYTDPDDDLFGTFYKRNFFISGSILNESNDTTESQKYIMKLLNLIIN